MSCVKSIKISPIFDENIGLFYKLCRNLLSVKYIICLSTK